MPNGLDDQDRIVVRTRGSFRPPGAGEGVDRARRGTARSAAADGGRPESGGSPRAVTSPTTLSSEINQIRVALGRLPLTVVIHDWGSDAHSAEFFAAIRDQLYPDDAVWLVGLPDQSSPLVPAETPRPVLIDRSGDLDLRVLRNLIADIVYVPVTDAHDWSGRARVVVIRGGADEPGPTAIAGLPKRATLVWNGGNEARKIL